MQLPTVASLWIGGNLSYIEQVCLKSFADHGHRTILYTYENVDNCPDGVEMLDANKIFPASDFIRHKSSGSPAVHADLFRYRMISLQNVIWVDADMLCMQPWAFKDQFVFGWEKTNRLVCNAVFGLPRFSRTLASLNAFCENEYPIPPWIEGEERDKLIAAAERGERVHVSELPWGVWGPAAVTYFLKQSGEIEHAMPQEAFYPISFKNRRDLLKPGDEIDRQLTDGCYGVHLWNRRLSRRLITHENGVAHPESFLGRALKRHNIDPLNAPIPDRPPTGFKTQDEIAKEEVSQPQEVPKPKPQSLPLATLQQTREYQTAINNLEARTKAMWPALSPPEEKITQDKILVLTSMKNEAPFILEWIAYHKAIGVTHFLVYTNDCTDNTNAMLDRLAELGIVTRLDNPWDPASGKKPQHVALNDAQKQPVLQDADWVLTIDVDEFVNIHVGGGTFPELFEACNDPNVISFTWKFFGNDNIREYQDRPIMEQFTACAPEFIPKPRLGWGFKSMVHRSAPYTKIGVHRPLKIENDEAVSRVRWVNGSGRVMPEMLLTNNGWRSTKRSLGYRFATLNHYILRSAESFLVKRDRGRINHTEQDQGIDYWMRRNYTSEQDPRMIERLPMMEKERSALLADEQLSKLHNDAVEWHKAKIATLKADSAYAELYHELTEIARPDAIYLTKPEQESAGDDDDEGTGVAIPEPELNTLSPEQAEQKLGYLESLLNAKTAHSDLNSVQVDPPETTSSDFHTPEPPVSAITGEFKERYRDARAYAAKCGGFFWEGPDNALFFEPRGKRLVIVFDNLSVVKTDQQRWPWGYKVLSEELDCSILGVMASQRNWFRHDFVHDCFDLLSSSQFFDQFDDVLFYGTSMGGFAALSYSRCVPNARVLAVAPQTTLDPRIMPDDNRWGWRKKLDWDGRYCDARGATDAAKDVVVISDPYFELDRVQVDRLEGPNIRKLRMPFFGHQLPNAFVKMGIIKPLLLDMFDDNLTNERFYKRLRARRDLPRYQHDLLMEAEKRGHVKLAIQVCEYTLRKREAGNIRRSLERLQKELEQAE
ncbi:glycosyltransferase family 2 protein [Falsihalocynthiibacter sp. SS001]|uniref:glycosyltransferase family 2 protein n=1 Tax=Falsihalocynthiibacter sp. SS001 TaxID=3349698 RepID=UPI0036D2C72C